MIVAAGLDWRVKQRPLQAVLEREYETLHVPVPRHVANVRSDTCAVLGVVGDGYEPLQNSAAFAFCNGGVGPRHREARLAGGLAEKKRRGRDLNPRSA